jgi:hypothetical protein
VLSGPCVFATAHTSRFHGGVPELARLDKMELQAFPGRHVCLGCVRTNCGSVVFQGFGMWKRRGEQNWVMLQRRKAGRVVSFAAADDAGTQVGNVGSSVGESHGRG